MRRLAFLALWLLVLTIPFENIVAMPGIGSLTRLIGLVAIAAALCAVGAGMRLRRPATFHVAVLAFVAWAALTLLWTVDTPSSVIRAWTYLQVVAVAGLIWQMAPDESRQLELMSAYVCGAYVSAVWLFVNAFSGNNAFAVTGRAGYEYDQRYVITGTDPNDLGLTLALAVPLAWYLAARTQSRALRMGYLLYVPAAVAAISLTGSRGAMLALVVALLIVPLTSRKLSVVRITLMALGMGLTVYATFALVPEAVLARLGTTVDQIASGSFSARGDIWSAGVDAFTIHPFLGHGTGAFAQAVYAVSSGSVDQVAHNALLSVLVEHGLVGFLLMLLALGLTVRPVLRMESLRRMLWIVISLTLLTGASALSFEYRKPTWFLLGLLVAHGAATAVVRSPRRRQLLLTHRSQLSSSTGNAIA